MNCISMNFNTTLLAFLIITFGTIPALSSGPDTNYCKVECPPGTSHTVCDRKNNCGPVAPCIVLEPTVAFRSHMVHAHNEKREAIASGKEKGPYNNPGAKNMNALSYDLELEYLAGCWNNKCGPFEHDTCRHSKRWMVGQNMYIGSNTNATAEAIPGWFGEIQYVTDANWLHKYDSKSFPKDGKQRGHFTQMIWANIEYVGCSLVLRDEYKKEVQLVCNYGPGGNFVGSEAYQFAGSPAEIASACKDGKKNSQYPSLCGDIKAIPTDPMWVSRSAEKLSMSILFHIVPFSALCYFSFLG